MMNEKHSSVCYIFREGAFSPVKEGKPFRNDFGLDLFQYKGAVYEGRTGLHLCPLQEAEYLDLFIKSHGGIEQVQQIITRSLERTGLSPRYARPDEKKKDIFPPKEKDENRVFAKDLMGNKHSYYRFYNENGIELYTMEKGVLSDHLCSVRWLHGGNRPETPAGGNPEMAAHAEARHPG